MYIVYIRYNARYLHLRIKRLRVVQIFLNEMTSSRTLRIRMYQEPGTNGRRCTVICVLETEIPACTV